MDTPKQSAPSELADRLDKVGKSLQFSQQIRLAGECASIAHGLRSMQQPEREEDEGDPHWWREYYMFTGQHMILTDEGWESGDSKQSYIEMAASDGILIDELVLDEVNAPGAVPAPPADTPATHVETATGKPAVACIKCGNTGWLTGPGHDGEACECNSPVIPDSSQTVPVRCNVSDLRTGYHLCGACNCPLDKCTHAGDPSSERVVFCPKCGCRLEWGDKIASPETQAPERWRVGTKVKTNVYAGDRPVCQCHDDRDAVRIVISVNRMYYPPIAPAVADTPVLPEGAVTEYRCARCGSSLLPSGQCSRYKEGCQGGWGESRPNSEPAQQVDTREREWTEKTIVNDVFSRLHSRVDADTPSDKEKA